MEVILKSQTVTVSRQYTGEIKVSVRQSVVFTGKGIKRGSGVLHGNNKVVIDAV